MDWPRDDRQVHHRLPRQSGQRADRAPRDRVPGAPADVAAYQQLDDADPAPGYVCFGGPGGPNGGADAQWLGAWAPGTLGNDFPAGTGIKVPAGIAR